MSSGAVKFHAQPVRLVQVVQVAHAAAVPALSLPPGRRQPVSALHAMDVMPLERGVHAVGGVLQGRGDPAAPPHPRASGEHLAEHLRRGQPAPHRRRDPAVRVVETPRGGDQVEHGVLHRRPRQLPRRHPLRHQPPPPVNHHPPDRADLARIPRRGDAYVDLRDSLIGETVNLGGSLMAEGCARPGSQHCCPQPCLPGRCSAEGGIGPALEALPRTCPDPPVDCFFRPARISRLLPRYDTSLSVQQPQPVVISFDLHPIRLDRPARQRHTAPKPVDNSIRQSSC